MTGFYSKDLILESAFGQFCFEGIAVYLIAVIGAIFTTLYSVKILFLAFLTNPNGPVNYYKHAHEGNIFMSLPLAILALFSIYFGFITKEIYIGMGSSFFNDNSIFIHPLNEILIDTEFGVDTQFKLLPFVFTLSFSILAILISEYSAKDVNSFKLSNLGYYIFGFFNQRFLIELFYNNYIVKEVLDLGGQTSKGLDKGSIELMGPFGAYVFLIYISKSLIGISNSVVTRYALFFILQICILYLVFIFDNYLIIPEWFIVTIYLLLLNIIISRLWLWNS